MVLIVMVPRVHPELASAPSAIARVVLAPVRVDGFEGSKCWRD